MSTHHTTAMTHKSVGLRIRCRQRGNTITKLTPGVWVPELDIKIELPLGQIRSHTYIYAWR